MLHKLPIYEVILVEGIHDSAQIKQFFYASCLTLGGWGATRRSILHLARRAGEKRGLLLLLDPDVTGERIRALLHHELSGLPQDLVKDVHLPFDRAVKGKHYGVEYARYPTLLAAFEKAQARFEEAPPILSWSRFQQITRSGEIDAEEDRRRIEEKFELPRCSAKTLWEYLNYLEIDEEKLQEILN